MIPRALPLISASAVLVLASPTSSEAAAIDLATGTPAQSSQLGGFAAANAVDSIVNFTHTLNSDTNATWQVLMPDPYAFDVVTIYNRASSDGTLDCCPSRLRDITIQIVDFSGDVGSDFTGGTVAFSSVLLNPENEIGGGTSASGPVSLTANPGGAIGNLIRVIRTPDDDLSGTGGVGNADEGRVLSLDLVTADGTLIPEPGVPLLALLGLGVLGLRRRR